jgi:hypothetical protein
MTPLQQAQQEWEAVTTPHPKQHFYENGKKQVGKHQFRKFGQAIALLNWCENIEMTKLEKLPSGGRGATIPIVEFLKTLADNYHIRIFGHVKPYTPDPPWSDDEYIPTQEELEAWYKKRGFHLCMRGKLGAVALWYPDVPHFETDDGAK